MRLSIVLVLLMILFSATELNAKVQLSDYGVSMISDSLQLKSDVNFVCDSMNNRIALGKGYFDDFEKSFPYNNRTTDFYLVLLLFLLLGIIRYTDTQYFYNLWQAFWNPILSSRQLKEQLQREQLPNFLMNSFFAIAEGAYLYYVVKFFTPYNTGYISSSLLVILLIGGTAIIYLIKYLSIRFSGWAFRVEGITDQYLFNVFLINKILGILLLPFIVILAFADRTISMNFVFMSFLVFGGMILNRYIRSWQALGSFFQYSKFHFFMYLCTSELLPLSVLIKLMVKGLMF